MERLIGGWFVYVRGGRQANRVTEQICCQRDRGGWIATEIIATSSVYPLIPLNEASPTKTLQRSGFIARTNVRGVAAPNTPCTPSMPQPCIVSGSFSSAAAQSVKLRS
jgi:hypothetical protein